MVFTKTYTLNTGAKIPAVGLGTWQSPDDEAYTAVKTAIASGYRHIDTAWAYGNEEAVGRAIRDGLKENNLKREDVFVTTKLWSTFHRPEKVEEGIQESLTKLSLDYVDLYLMHWPVALNPEKGEKFPTREDGSRDLDEKVTIEETWAALEKVQASGKAKAVGVSNFSIPFLERLLKSAKTVPAANQVELHPYLPQHKLLEYCASKGIHVTAYSPLGSTNSPLLTDATVTKIAEKHGKSPAQVLLSWGATRTSILPKSVTPSRIESNIDLFELSPEEVKEIEALQTSKAHRFCAPNWGVDLKWD
ncbi:NADP-dependent oxidoreductase domain-containing protein [Syncephalastrum racemosum]|uniref:NADP-dependent oxidoreductase domain-containing protein n=1 Tax=Syncephalastrum racemosum TaxID=13706 RepID=A0A1X2HGG0_SYNRA|nr:NADP-dependent oxidoreductase domain-containing protein [Syncephalastrum racemosum]